MVVVRAARARPKSCCWRNEARAGARDDAWHTPHPMLGMRGGLVLLSLLAPVRSNEVSWINNEYSDWSSAGAWSGDPYEATEVEVCSGAPSLVHVSQQTSTQAQSVSLCFGKKMVVSDRLCIGPLCAASSPPPPVPVGEVNWVGGATGDWSTDSEWDGDPYDASVVRLCGAEESVVTISEPTNTQGDVDLCTGHVIDITSSICIGSACIYPPPAPPAPPPAFPADGTVLWIGGTDEWSLENGWTADPYDAPKLKVCRPSQRSEVRACSRTRPPSSTAARLCSSELDM